MWNFMNTMGHPGHFMAPFRNQKRDLSIHVENISIVPGKAFTNPNFVNKHHPSVHSYQNNFILTPIQKISHTDNTKSDVDTNKPHHNTNGSLLNSSQSIADKIKENNIEAKTEPLMCRSKRPNKKNRRKKDKPFGKSARQNMNRQHLNEMMDIDLEIELSVSVSDVSMSPETSKPSLNLTDFIIVKPKQTKSNYTQPDAETEQIVELSTTNYLPGISRVCMRERQVSVTESEDSFIVFDGGTEELESSEESDECETDECETDEETDNPDDEVDFCSVIPHKKVRFAEDGKLCEVHPMVQWAFAYHQSRKGPWEEYARDRERFSRRIADMEKIISPIFDIKHREDVYAKRFKEKIVAF
ncbi:hypothetical protein NQ317_009021 [Molorchus minor]|uniref:Protein DP71L n=1 Tax=Molorchus minor TaxID=1323400 RepID=A0ABQ9JAL5_9CUCU|nr:hypothetical protein NQ317_009021 [Molorchus minor]